MSSSALALAERWFAQRQWQPFDFQRQVWEAFLAGESGLIHAPTGTGKTYAVWWGALLPWLIRHPDAAAWAGAKAPKLRVLWLTPLRALAADTAQALQAPLSDLGLPWTVARRTGDTSSARKQRQLKQPPSALITTPESLSLILSRPEGKRFFAELETVVVDEWHELLGNKRGVQTELGLARLRRWRPEVRIWGLSATMGNLETARAALLGLDEAGAIRAGRLVRGLVPKEVVIDALIPDAIERFPWAGHMGLKMLPQVIAAIEEGRSALVFTNTRNQTENWYQAILKARPEWAGQIALHHGSLAAKTRRWVEDGLRQGALRCVVCTSSLDLGVDFTPVDRVLQVGSPKGVARLLQRAGRSGHQPGVVSRVTCVPTHAFELVEVVAVRNALAAGQIEARDPVQKPLDVLVQHLVTVALGGGFEAAQLKEEVRSSYAYRALTDAEWEWALRFVSDGGEALTAYSEYQRVRPQNGRYRVPERRIGRRHRLSIGTIVSDAALRVKYLNGGSLGTITESFISRLKPGDKFIFAGRSLEFVRVRDMTAWVRRAKNSRGAIPAWSGTSLPISAALGAAVRAELHQAALDQWDGPEMMAVQPVLTLQKEWSRIPTVGQLLVERLKTREGWHLFFYPFEGKLVHQGLAALFAYRLARRQPLSVALTANDYGFELLSPDPPPLAEALIAEDGIPSLFSRQRLLDEIPASLNASEMARRQFREIARVAGLVFSGFPGQQRSARHLQASSSLFYEVFRKYDAGNLLLRQADREVLERQLEHGRLSQTLARLADSELLLVDLQRPSPLAFPLLVERLQARLSTEKLADRVRRMTVSLEKAASAGTA
ncbi:MAG: ligase-associated DNA damage response DEXH box helicase [Candidatus Promineifilaceae bacterium]|nr:ligase-associated DNA damage response DEXH box helicase [Candidatus Promineifilaceae bacterium]